MGSLVTALASWLDARAGGYRWLVRIEDLDTPREEPGAAHDILHQLQCHGLSWDTWNESKGDGDGVLYQSSRHAAYDMALEDLIRRGRAYACTCSRKRLQVAVDLGKTFYNPDGEIIYPGFCRPQDAWTGNATDTRQMMNNHDRPGVAWRFRNDDGDDFVLRRADGFWAYHMACVVDDAYQGITHIVRGDDLLCAAPRHTALRRALGYPEPQVMHVPIVRNEAGEKLSKQTRAQSLRTDNNETVRMQLECAWSHLELTMPPGWVTRVRPACERLVRNLETDEHRN
jgi:glutamyl-Q tRNA(Asp) synthetase